jgi:tRNA threonylcarbamoyladenosine biosynthesis protein TsaE
LTPNATDGTFDLITHNPAHTHTVGKALGGLLQAGDVVCLQGNLGSGKTCLTQGIGAGMHVSGTINSPTFVFVCEHPPLRSGPYLYHADLYRISDVSEVFSLGLEDYMYGDGVTVIEWADRALEALPPQRLWVTLTYTDETERTMRFEAAGARYLDLLAAFKGLLSGPLAQASAASPRPA